MTDTWKVHLKNIKNRIVTRADVSLVPTASLAGKDFPYQGVAATHQHTREGVFEAAQQPTSGLWTLIIRASGMTPVVQALTLTPNGGHLTTKPQGGQLQVVEIRHLTGLRGSGDQVTMMSVTLHPEKEFVWATAPTGTDGTRFDEYAHDRAEELRRRKVFDRGTLMTLLSGARRLRVHMLPRLRDGFVEVAASSVGSRLSIVEFYEYLDRVGSNTPKRVLEIGVFSHAIAGGPILSNTGDVPGPRRGNNDTDGRTKDWNQINTPGWSQMPAALHAGAFFQIWGCTATDEYHQGISRSTGNGDVFFHIAFKHHRNPRKTFILRTTPNLVKRDIDRQFRDLTTYASGAAQFLKRPVKAPPPGVGANLTPGKPNIMSPDRTAYRRVYVWMEQTFGVAGRETKDRYDAGYVDYRALAALAQQPLPGNHTGYHFVDMEVGNRAKVRLGLHVRRSEQLPWQAVDSQATEIASPPLVASGVKVTNPPAGGSLHLFRNTKNLKQERAYLVDRSNHVYLLRRSGGTLVIHKQIV